MILSYLNRDICDLADKYGALVFIDECHATGFLGKTGRGTEEFLNLAKNRVHIVNSTLGKALGGAAGGYTTGPKEVIALLRQRSRPYLFSNTLPPAVVASASKVRYITCFSFIYSHFHCLKFFKVTRFDHERHELAEQSKRQHDAL